MQNEKSYFPQQNNNEEQSIDIKQFIYTALSHWYLFVIFVVLALIVGFFINRYSTNIYQTTGTILINEGRSSYDATAIMTSGNFTSNQVLDNELAVLRSYTLTERVIKKMNLEVTYMEKGRITSSELYKNAPFLVEYDRSVPQAVDLKYELTFLDNGNIGQVGLFRFHYRLSILQLSRKS